MASTKFYLDSRRAKSDTPCALKISLTHHTKSILINLGIKLLPSQWDEKKHKIVKHPEATRLNIFINKKKQDFDRIIFILASEERLNQMSVLELKEYILLKSDPEKVAAEERKNKFAYRLRQFAEQKETESTKKMYLHTLSRITQSLKGKNVEDLSFEEMNREWLTKFESYLAKTACKNARNIHLRNIRAVFNDAIDDEITTAYPFRKFKIRPEATRKRSLSVEDMRTLFNYPVEEYAQIHLDMFKLIFMLIGINAIDLCHLKDIVNGRVEYKRAKTHKLYSIKVEPEALEIINRYRGKNWLINAMDRYTSHADFTKHVNKALKRIGEMKRVGRGGKKVFNPLFPDISTYWARHSWATIAASLDIPKDTIAHALGHGNNTVTDIYIDFDMNKVDEANRKVLDWVLYNKR